MEPSSRYPDPFWNRKHHRPKPDLLQRCPGGQTRFFLDSLPTSQRPPRHRPRPQRPAKFRCAHYGFSASYRLDLVGSLSSCPNQTFRIDFYRSSEPDSTGYGEGEQWIGTTTVQTDVDGQASFELSLTNLTALSDSDWITTLVTSSQGDSSEFSKAVPVQADPTEWPDLKIQIQGPALPIKIGQIVSLTLTAIYQGPTNAPISAEPITLWLDLPESCQATNLDETATIQGNRILWSLPAPQPDQPQTASVSIQCLRSGSFTFGAALQDPGPIHQDDQASWTVQILGAEAPQLTVQDTEVPEPDTGVQLVAVPVILSAPTAQPVTFTYRLTEGTATPDVDFQSGGGTGQIPAGETRTWIYVPVIGDQDPEPDETIRIDLLSLQNAWTETPSATLTLRDNDTPPPLQADLQIQLHCQPETLLVGSNLFCTLTITNLGPDTAPAFLLTNRWPAALSLQSIAPESLPWQTNQPGVLTNTDGTVITNQWGELTLVGESLAPGEGLTIQIQFQAVQPATFTNLATILPTTNTTATSFVPSVVDPNLTNNLAQASITILSQPPLPVEPASPIVFNPQSGLFEQIVRVRNLEEDPWPAVRLFVHGLTPPVRLYNASGTADGVPFVQLNRAIEPGEEALFVLEFFDPYRMRAFQPTYTIAPTFPCILPSQKGKLIQPAPGRAPLILHGGLNEGRFLIEFRAEPGGQYLIQYRDSDTGRWKDALPTIYATANVVQWIDAGPPKTDRPPSEVSMRFYRVLRLR